jgi:hypothetical protein
LEFQDFPGPQDFTSRTSRAYHLCDFTGFSRALKIGKKFQNFQALSRKQGNHVCYLPAFVAKKLAKLL